MKARLIVSCVAVLLSAAIANASNITYNVSEHVGTSSAIGTITTDGTIGTLNSGNIVDYTFTVANSSTSNTFSKGFVNSAGSNFSGTATGLFFDYSAVGGIVFGDGPTQNFLCFASGGVLCSHFGGTVIMVDENEVSDTSRTGVQQVGSNDPAVTPEPTSLILLGTGALGAIGMVRRRVIAS